MLERGDPGVCPRTHVLPGQRLMCPLAAELETSQDRHAPAGRADTPVTRLGRTSSYQVTQARPVACTFTRPCRDRPTDPGMTPRSGRFRVRPTRQDHPHDQGPAHPHWRFSLPLVSDLSAPVPHVTSRRPTTPRRRPLPASGEVVPGRVGEGAVERRGWHGMQEVRPEPGSAQSGCIASIRSTASAT
jgi:hypothetical protein